MAPNPGWVRRFSLGQKTPASSSAKTSRQGALLKKEIFIKMKNKHLFQTLVCLLAMFIVGCENSEFTKKISSPDQPIELRAEDCEDCPVNDCCCSVEMTAGLSMELVFCGTTGPFLSSSECEFDIMGCNLITGYYEYHTITSVDPKYFFCVSPGTGFSIGSTSGNASFTVTCQEGDLDPQSENFNISGPQRHYFTVNGGCEVGPCP
jgi:hypothetical protein